MISFGVVGWDWGLHLDDTGGGLRSGHRRMRSFWLFALAAIILAIGQISLFWYYTFARVGGFQFHSRLGVVAVATGVTAVGYLLVATRFCLQTRPRLAEESALVFRGSPVA